MPRAGFEPPTPASERTKIHAFSVSQPPGRGPVPGRDRPEETTICYKILLVQFVTDLNGILYLSTGHTVYIRVLILFMIMS